MILLPLSRGWFTGGEQVGCDPTRSHYGRLARDPHSKIPDQSQCKYMNYDLVVSATQLCGVYSKPLLLCTLVELYQGFIQNFELWGGGEQDDSSMQKHTHAHISVCGSGGMSLSDCF